MGGEDQVVSAGGEQPPGGWFGGVDGLEEGLDAALSEWVGDDNRRPLDELVDQAMSAVAPLIGQPRGAPATGTVAQSTSEAR